MLPKIHKPHNAGRPVTLAVIHQQLTYVSIWIITKVNCSKSPILHEGHTGVLENYPNQDSILITLDIQSIYINTPQDEGTQICLSAMEEF